MRGYWEVVLERQRRSEPAKINGHPEVKDAFLPSFSLAIERVPRRHL